jgi:hypothetical protein
MTTFHLFAPVEQSTPYNRVTILSRDTPMARVCQNSSVPRLHTRSPSYSRVRVTASLKEPKSPWRFASQPILFIFQTGGYECDENCLVKVHYKTRTRTRL